MTRKLLWIGSFILILTLMIPLGIFAADKTATNKPVTPVADKTAIEKPAAPQPQSTATVLTLDQCLELAFKNSQSIQTAAKNVEIAQEAVNEAKAGLLPALTYSYSDTYYNDSTMNSNHTNQSSSAGLTLTQPLFTSGRLTNTLKLKQLSLESAKEDERKAKEGLTLLVKQYYYQCWVSEQKLIVAQNSYNNLNHHFDQVNAFYKVGTVSKFDLLKAQVQRDSLKPQVVIAQNAVILAKLNLATQIGSDKNQDFDVKIDLAQIKIPDQNSIDFNSTLSSAYQNRSELHKIQQAAQIAKLTTAITAAAYLPTINASASYAGNGGTDIFPSKTGLTLNLTVNGTIWNGGATQAKVAQSKGSEDLIAIQESSLKDTIRTDVEKALQSLTQAIETTKANQANIDLSKESLRMAQARYDNGMGTTMDIMDAELALDTTLNGYYTGVSDYLSALANIDMVVANDK